MGEETYCKKYKYGSCNSDAISKYGMVKSRRTFRPLKSALKATFNMSGDTAHNGKFPSFLTASLPVPTTLCSVSPPTSIQHGPSVQATVPDCWGRGPDIQKKVSFATVIQSYTPTGDIHFNKVSILSPGLQLFRERTQNRYKRTKRSSSNLASALSSTSSASPQAAQRPVSPTTPRTAVSPATPRTAVQRPSPPATPNKGRNGSDLQ